MTLRTLATDPAGLAVAIVVLAAATYRVARLVAVDTVTTPWRAVVYRFAWADPEPWDGPDDRPEESDGAPQPRAGWRTYVYEFVTCPHCLGVWIAIGAAVAWWHWAWVLWPLVTVAAMGVQSFAASLAGE